MSLIDLHDTVKVIDVARAHGVTYLALFGSVARGEEDGDSDVDIAVRFGRRVSLFDLVDLQLSLQQILSRSVDLIPVDDVYSFMLDQIKRDQIVLFDVANERVIER